MDNLALAFRRNVLLRVSFSLLRDEAKLRRSARETDRFFTRLETRADKARALFLLTKAFTHWAKSAEDEVQRTSVARRHILRTRFFNGWREITAVNELKTQHFVLGRFLRKLQAKAKEIQYNEAYAVALYEENLRRRMWRNLWFKFANNAAPRRHNDVVKRQTLRKLVEISQLLRERSENATNLYERAVVRKELGKWQQKAVTVRSQQVQANEHHQYTQLLSALRTLQKQAQLQPLLRQFQTSVNNHRMRNAFQGWQKDAELSRKARNVDQMRILRNTYTAWNDRLRSKVVEDRINDRVIVKALYKWTLASRVSLFQRVHDRQLKESTFLTWVTKANQRANTLDAAERRFAQFKRNQLLRTCLRKMELIASEKRREEFAILAEYQQKLKQRVFDTLKERNAHFQQLNVWTKDARFYMLSKRTLKVWGEATQHARRNRRRETYAQVRRLCKTNLVKKVFEHWRDRSSHIAALDQQATEFLKTRTLQSVGVKLHAWHDRAILLRQLDGQATSLFSQKLGHRFFDTWFSRLDTLQRLAGQAVALRQESAEIAAASALKKLGWRLWNLQRQEDNAKALHGRNFEKHVRAMIRYWLEQAAERRAERARDASPSPTSRSRSSRRGDGDDGNQNEERQDDDSNAGPATLHTQTADDTVPLEPWTAFDETALDFPTNNDLDLSLTITPERQQSQSQSKFNLSAASPSNTRPSIFSQRGSEIKRPSTFPQPQSQSILRPPPLHPTIQEDDEEELGGVEGEDTFWSGTPLPPPPSALLNRHRQSTTITNQSAMRVSRVGKPGYLKTPSKRTIVRSKHPELAFNTNIAAPGLSPEKNRLRSPVRRALGLDLRVPGAGSMSAPPVAMSRDVGGGVGGVSSFQRRLKEGGFGGTVGAGGTASRFGSSMRGARGRGNGKARARVEFEEGGEEAAA
ncbi:hypothetical protein NX059_002406 [Plenodomus lindquistii]|nr:hypothetical protein NX059_002406 [Plenodomus lindquistii]